MAPEKAHLQVETCLGGEVADDLTQPLALLIGHMLGEYPNTSEMLHQAILPVAAAMEWVDSIAKHDLGLIGLP